MNQIFALEKALLSTNVRRNAEALNLLIADEFIEFGKSGKMWCKGDILASLPLQCEAQYEILHFSVIFETSSIVCVEYQMNEGGESSLRRSIWKFIDERWQMVFHRFVN